MTLTSPEDTDPRNDEQPEPKTDASILHLMHPVSLTPDMTKPPAPKGGQRLHRVGARLAPLGKWPLEAAYLRRSHGRPECIRFDCAHALKMTFITGIVPKISHPVMRCSCSRRREAFTSWQ